MDADVRGKASESIVRGHLLEHGFVTSTPDCDCKYDLVVDVDDDLVRAQVKRGFADGSRDRTLRVNLYDQTRGEVAYSGDDVDAFVIHDPVNDRVYWMWFDEAPASEIRRKYDSMEEHMLSEKLKGQQ